jgi:UDP-N-acetylmuramoyl-tripeptide--D-alanyl-D-alanine ligase
MPSLASLDSAEIDGRIIRVADSVVALQSLACWNRQQSGALVVGVTGSVGKTTTRQMITQVLEVRYSGVQSPHNYNNELGVPLSLLQLEPRHDFAVLELAAGRIGEIRFLTDIVKPEFAVVTRVAATHLASFGDLNAIRQAKMELPASVATGGTVFLNADDPAVLSMSESTSANIVLFGTSAAADFRATSIHSQDGICRFIVDGQLFQIQGGSHLVTGAVAAIAVGRIAGLSPSEIAQGLANYQPDAGRGRIVQRQPWTVIDESYNASPASVLAAIQTLNDFGSAHRRILVLGDMLELGPEASHFHRAVGGALQNTQIDHALIYGDFAEVVTAGAIAAGVSPNRISVFRDIATLNIMLDCILTPGDAVLVKGSRSMHMERIIKSLCETANQFGRSAA